MTRVLEHDLTCLDCQRTRTVRSGGWSGRNRTSIDGFRNRRPAFGRRSNVFVSPEGIEPSQTEGKNLPLYQ